MIGSHRLPATASCDLILGASTLEPKLQFTRQPRGCTSPAVISFLFFSGFHSNSLQKKPCSAPFPPGPVS